MNWLHYCTTQSIDWCYNGLDESVFFFFYSFSQRKLHLISFVVHYSVIQLRHFWSNYFWNNFSSLVVFLRLACLLMMVGTSSAWSVIIDRQNVLAIHFLMKYVLQQQFLYCFTWSSNQFLILNILSFLFLQIFYLSTWFLSVLTLEPSAIYWLAICITCFTWSKWVYRHFLQLEKEVWDQHKSLRFIRQLT